MSLVIRENVAEHLRELKAWLEETEEVRLEEMGEFFARRLSDYEEHMQTWTRAYERFAELLPGECREILDLGCGTGLELDEIWKKNPEIAVTGVDLCGEMLERLQEKHGDKQLVTVCADYFCYDMGEERWDGVISFESLHHFLPEKKVDLYRKIYAALKYGGYFVLGDYIACCDEEERMLQEVCMRKRRREGIPAEQFVHFDIPLTLEKEMNLLRAAGFSGAETVESLDGATILVLKK